jgi:SnoaL-like domain
VEAIHNEQKIAGLAGLYTSDAVVITPDGRYEGTAALTAWLDAFVNGFSDFELETSVLLERGEYVMAE